MLAGGALKIDGRVIRRVIVVVNAAAGRAGAGAPEAAREILMEAGLEPDVQAPDPAHLETALEAAHSAKPDLLILVAGDGTARAAASLCGPKGPLLAPLPGGTMNMLPHALYGARDWRAALRDILTDGVVRSIARGSVEGQPFYVAAILGEPALWADAREAARAGHLGEAFRRAQRALRRTVEGRLRFSINEGPIERADALALITPLISRVLRDEAPTLEAVTLDPHSAVDVFRLAASALAGDWRADPTVASRLCRKARIFASSHIPAILDGEPVRLGRTSEVRFQPHALRVLALERHD